MSAIDFDLTPEDCSMRGYIATGQTTPSYDEVVDLILDASAEIIALFDGKNVNYAAPSSDAVLAAGWRQGRSYVKNRVRADWLRLSGGEEARADKFHERATEIYRRIRDNAILAAGDSADTTSDAADLPYLPRVDKVYNGDAEDTDTGPITTGRRLIANREI